MKRFCFLLICALFVSVGASAQTTSDYDILVQKGKTQLQAGTADLALASGEAAIKMNPDRWEGYALAGGALMNLKRYEDAADKFSEAIKRAPEAKQPALRDLRRQCLLAESGVSPAAKESAPATTTQAEIVLWKSIENSTNPTDFQAYLDQYPQGAFSGLAKRHLDELKYQAEQRTKQERQTLIETSVWPDPSTGFTWAKHDSGEQATNSGQADAFCRNLRLLGYSDWRLPTVDELAEIYDPTLPAHIKGNIKTTYWCEWAAEGDGTHKTFTFRSGKPSGWGGGCGTAVRGALCLRKPGKPANDPEIEGPHAPMTSPHTIQ